MVQTKCNLDVSDHNVDFPDKVSGELGSKANKQGNGTVHF